VDYIIYILSCQRRFKRCCNIPFDNINININISNNDNNYDDNIY
jgi:hypothetical protein